MAAGWWSWHNMGSKGITIITRDNCYWCHKAKELMDEKQMTYIELHIPNSLSVEEFQSLTEQYETTKTVPKIFLNFSFFSIIAATLISSLSSLLYNEFSVLILFLIKNHKVMKIRPININERNASALKSDALSDCNASIGQPVFSKVASCPPTKSKNNDGNEKW